MARTNKNRMLKLTPGDKSRYTIGLGDCSNRSNIMAMFKSAALCAVYAMPTIAKIQWEFAGPISHADTLKTLGATIDILGQGDNPAGVDEVYHTPGLINGQFQTYIMACAVGVHLEASPYCALVRGNSFVNNHSGTGTAPFSPDAWTVNDQTNAWGQGVTAPTCKAVLRYGQPALEAFWAMVRAYNLRWTYGSLINILDEQLRETAYMPPNAQEGSASSSEIDAVRLAREVNARYASLGSAQDFRVTDTIRLGSIGAGGANSGIFAPNFDLQSVGVTYGGSDLRAKIGIGTNSEFRSLCNPYILKPGVPPGLVFEEQNQELGDYFRAQFDVTCGPSESSSTGLVPAQYTESADYTAGATSGFTERSIDGQSVTQTTIATEAEYKGFRALMSNEVKGWEMTESLACQIRDNADLAAALCNDCGVMIGWAG